MSDAAEPLRPFLLSLAYRMTADRGEAEDLVQEAYLRLLRARAEGEAIRSERAFLTTVTTRLAIDHLRSARVRREAYPGPWLPEPLVTEPGAGPADQIELADTLSLAFLALLERLTPVERAVLLLRDVFGFGYDEVAEAVERSEANCRQIAARARRHVAEGRPRFRVSRAQHEELTERFMRACRVGDVDGLAALLTADAVAYTDGGGRAAAAPQPIHGREKVARFLVGISRPERVPGGVYDVRTVDVNGQPGRLVVGADGAVLGVLVLEVAGGAVTAVRVVANPDKLRRADPSDRAAQRYST